MRFYRVYGWLSLQIQGDAHMMGAMDRILMKLKKKNLIFQESNAFCLRIIGNVKLFSIEYPGAFDSFTLWINDMLEPLNTRRKRRRY